MEKSNYTKWVEETHCPHCCNHVEEKCELDPDTVCHFEDAWIACENAYRPSLKKLEKVVSTLDIALGDTDPYIDDEMSDEDIRQQQPLFWACKEVATIVAVLSE